MEIFDPNFVSFGRQTVIQVSLRMGHEETNHIAVEIILKPLEDFADIERITFQTVFLWIAEKSSGIRIELLIQNTPLIGL